jgi:hypothetical protein
MVHSLGVHKWLVEFPLLLAITIQRWVGFKKSFIAVEPLTELNMHSVGKN